MNAGAMDYYLILSGSGNPEGILIERFVRNNDGTTAGLHSAGWNAAQRAWWSSASFSRGVREDLSLAARTVPVGRGAAEMVYAHHGAGPLPTEALLGNHFQDYLAFPASPVLRLSPHDGRLYRVLFAKSLDPAGLANLQARWGGAEGGPGVMASGRLAVGQDLFTWDLRRIGPGLAWCVDVSVLSDGTAEDAVAGLLGELTSAVRRQGLIPVTTERFS